MLPVRVLRTSYVVLFNEVELICGKIIRRLPSSDRDDIANAKCMKS